MKPIPNPNTTAINVKMTDGTNPLEMKSTLRQRRRTNCSLDNWTALRAPCMETAGTSRLKIGHRLAAFPSSKNTKYARSGLSNPFHCEIQKWPCPRGAAFFYLITVFLSQRKPACPFAPAPRFYLRILSTNWADVLGFESNYGP